MNICTSQSYQIDLSQVNLKQLQNCPSLFSLRHKLSVRRKQTVYQGERKNKAREKRSAKETQGMVRIYGSVDELTIR